MAQSACTATGEPTAVLHMSLSGTSGLRFEQNHKLYRELANAVFGALVWCVRDAHNVNIEVGFACFPFFESC